MEECHHRNQQVKMYLTIAEAISNSKKVQDNYKSFINHISMNEILCKLDINYLRSIVIKLGGPNRGVHTRVWSSQRFLTLRGELLPSPREYLADFRGVFEFKVWTHLESIFRYLSFAPKIGSLPQLGTEARPFEIFARKWFFFNFGHALMMLVSNCRYWLRVSKNVCFIKSDKNWGTDSP